MCLFEVVWESGVFLVDFVVLERKLFSFVFVFWS